MTNPRSAVPSLFAVLALLSTGGTAGAAGVGVSASAGASAPSQPVFAPSAAPAAASTAAASPPATAAVPVVPPPAPAPAIAQEPAASEPAAESGGVIERLPPSAFPAPHIRGIYGGSLWGTFHGLQWPYYPKTGIGVSGSAWLDTGYERLSYSNPVEPGIKYLLQQGRFLLRITPTYSGRDFFVQAQAELVANRNQNDTQASKGQDNVVDADDVWVRAGQWKRWDVQVGRFEGWEVYHFGMGLDINTLERVGAYGTNAPPEIYGVTHAFYRQSRAGQLALHVYPTNFLRFELGTVIGFNENGQNTVGARPVAVLDMGFIKVKVGAEYVDASNQADEYLGANLDRVKKRGAGGAIQLVLDPHVEAGVNAARTLVDQNDTAGNPNPTGSYTTTSFGGFANGRIVGDLLVGVGANLTKKDDLAYLDISKDVGHFDHLQAFGAVQYILAKQLFFKFVVAYARGHELPSSLPPDAPVFTNKMLSGRLRVMYLF